MTVAKTDLERGPWAQPCIIEPSPRSISTSPTKTSFSLRTSSGTSPCAAVRSPNLERRASQSKAPTTPPRLRISFWKTFFQPGVLRQFAPSRRRLRHRARPVVFHSVEPSRKSHGRRARPRHRRMRSHLDPTLRKRRRVVRQCARNAARCVHARVSFQSLRHQRAHAVHHESRSGSTTTAHACPYVRQRRNLLLYWKKRLEPSSPGRVSVVPDCNRAVVSRLRLPAALLHLAIRARGIASRQARTPVRGSESSYVDEPAPMACDRSHVFEQLHEKSGIIRDQVEVRLSSVTLHQR